MPFIWFVLLAWAAEPRPLEVKAKAEQAEALPGFAGIPPSQAGKSRGAPQRP